MKRYVPLFEEYTQNENSQKLVYDICYHFLDDSYTVSDGYELNDNQYIGRTRGTEYSSYVDNEGEWHRGGFDWTDWGCSADQVRKYIPDFNKD